MYDRGQRVGTSLVEVDYVRIDAATHDPVGQRIKSQHVLIGKEGVLLLPVQLRYAWPSELDLMARLAGLATRRRRYEVFVAPVRSRFFYRRLQGLRVLTAARFSFARARSQAPCFLTRIGGHP